jgi:GNAT superfamily N-acetyltransferase
VTTDAPVPDDAERPPPATRTAALPPGARRVADADADALVALIGAAYDEHPGCVLDLPGVDDDLPAPGTTAARRGSPWWVVSRGGELVATIGAGPLDDEARVELKRLYVRRDQRGAGLATALVRAVEAQAAGLGAVEVELWTDTRFAAGHRRYAALGYAPTGETRRLHDPSDTTEYRYLRSIEPAPPRATVPWHGSGGEVLTVGALPDGWSLVGRRREAAVVRVEVDTSWAVRRAEVVGGARWTSDGHDRWWLEGEPVRDLRGTPTLEVTGTPLDLDAFVGACRGAVTPGS